MASGSTKPLLSILGALLLGVLAGVWFGAALVRRPISAAARAVSAKALTPGTTDSTVPAEDTGELAGVDVVHLHVEHTLFHPMDGVVLNVERMNGRLVGRAGLSHAPGPIISLDDSNSFSVQIDQAVTRLAAPDLSTMINSYLLQRADSAVRRVDISFDGQQVVIQGKVHKLLTLPFVARGILSTTSKGELRMHLDEFRVAGMLNRDFLAFFGIRLDDVAQPKRESSFRVEGDDFITSLNELFPPPRAYGRLTRVHVEGQNLVQVIGVEPPEHAIRSIPKALPEPANYLYFTGGRLRFGRMTMDNVDLRMVDATPGTPFDFSLAHYQQQVWNGYVKVMPNLGVIVYAGNFGDTKAQSARQPLPLH